MDSTAFLRTSGGSLTGNLALQTPAAITFGNTIRQMLNLFNADYGIGIQSSTLYHRSAGAYSWFYGGIHNDQPNNPGTNGAETMRLNHLGSLSVIGTEAGYSSINRDSPDRYWTAYSQGITNKYRIWNNGAQTDVLTVSQNGTLEMKGGIIAPGGIVSRAVTLDQQQTGELVSLFNNGSDRYGIGVQSGTQYFRTGDHFAWYKDGIHSDTAFAPGAGGSTLLTLDSAGSLSAGGPLPSGGGNSGLVVKNRNDQAKTWTTYARNSGGTDQLAFYTSSGNRDVAALSPNGDMYLVGALSTMVLTIRGGADVAEPFQMSRPGEMEPGSVVVIDEENPGKLKLSTEAYDTRVAGIISGAGGVKPGLRLHQEGVMEGDHHVALSGWVYVKADATNGAIRPGDLLTTAENPGHAKRVQEHGQSQGAILGKAMSELDSGIGLVLVLVTLQ